MIINEMRGIILNTSGKTYRLKLCSIRHMFNKRMKNFVDNCQTSLIWGLSESLKAGLLDQLEGESREPT